MDNFLSTRSLRHVSHVQRDALKQGVSEMISNPAEEFNINNAYLLQFAATMEIWRITKLHTTADEPEYFITLINCVEVLLDFLAAKLKPEEETQYMKSIEAFRHRAGALYRKSSGGQRLFDRDGGSSLTMDISRMFREMQRQMDSRGMLTRKQSNPNLAMGDIE